MDALAKVSVADALTYVVAPLVALRVLHTLYAFVLRPGKKLRKYGEWAVITGATDGIGKAYAFELAKQGLKIFLVSRSEDKLVQVEQELKAKGFDAAHLAVDFSNFDAKARAAVKAKIGALDVGVLINNVGMSYPFTKFYHELTDEEARPAANAPPPRVRARARALTPRLLAPPSRRSTRSTCASRSRTRPTTTRAATRRRPCGRTSCSR